MCEYVKVKMGSGFSEKWDSTMKMLGLIFQNSQD